MAAHHLSDVTIVADADVVFEANRKSTEEAGLSYAIGAQITDEPHQVKEWRRSTPARTSLTVHVFT